jgi:hypothetical protein
VAEVVDVPPDGGLMRVPGTIPNRPERWTARQVFVAAAVCTKRRWAEPSPAPTVGATGGRPAPKRRSRGIPVATVQEAPPARTQRAVEILKSADTPRKSNWQSAAALGSCSHPATCARPP